jgi:hypothetical protein
MNGSIGSQFCCDLLQESGKTLPVPCSSVFISTLIKVHLVAFARRATQSSFKHLTEKQLMVGKLMTRGARPS